MADVGLALAAGLVAAINPCGFALLPVYLTLLVVGDDSPGRALAVRRALAATAAMTAGFVAVFGVMGLVISPVAGLLYRYLPWFTVAFGVLLVLLAGWLIAGRALPSFGLRPTRGPALRRSAGSMVLFGAAYALASLSCTIAPFLAIVASSFRAGSVLTGVGLFVAYAAGMGLLVGVAALAVATARPGAVARLRGFGPAISRLAGAVLLLAGGYVAYYGWYELRGDIDDPVVDAAQSVQRLLVDAVERPGAAWIAVLFGLLLGGVWAIGAIRTRRAGRTPAPVRPADGTPAAEKATGAH
ncbi:cytochrome C biogenesis protein CcdA [Virgisporangium aliadipatigenens]|uniref:Cytochrome C biogenesis protein CcdA n=1 Tax=Virgisporangium aliadipatigenens TaxID=741659 RepID=A0A8J4DUX1_9ACTN|nr:cytochrome c biogenesis CcdA family protein [Virgisporangium aliadipatigenens]GIJ50533.1 cytochrome C biogenesis protein CcdA [Virgisporangium aliadipatigenens]